MINHTIRRLIGMGATHLLKETGKGVLYVIPMLVAAPFVIASEAIEKRKHEARERQEAQREAADPVYRAKREAERLAEQQYRAAMRIAEERHEKVKRDRAVKQHTFAGVIIFFGVLSWLLLLNLMTYINPDKPFFSQPLLKAYLVITAVWHLLRFNYRDYYDRPMPLE